MRGPAGHAMEAPHSCFHEDEESLPGFTPGGQLARQGHRGQHHLTVWLPGRGMCRSGVTGSVTMDDRMEQEGFEVSLRQMNFWLR